jgi:hypothetical protein
MCSYALVVLLCHSCWTREVKKVWEEHLCEEAIRGGLLFGMCSAGSASLCPGPPPTAVAEETDAKCDACKNGGQGESGDANDGGKK